MFNGKYESRERGICVGITSRGETAEKPRFGRSLTLPRRAPWCFVTRRDPMNQSLEAVEALRDVITRNTHQSRGICAGITSRGETAGKPRFGRSLTLPGRFVTRRDPMNQPPEAVVSLPRWMTETRAEVSVPGITSRGETAGKPRFGRSLTLPRPQIRQSLSRYRQ